MLNVSASGTMIALDLIMIAYSLWVVGLGGRGDGSATGQLLLGAGVALLIWLGALHIGISSELLFPVNVGGPAFFVLVLLAVAAVGALLLGVPFLRKRVLALSQEQLMLLQGIRVFFGATFLMQGALGQLPQAFAILDGFTHVSAGFFGLIAAFSLAGKVSGNRRAWFANIFGLADILVVASTLAFILLPQIGPHHSMMYAVFLPAPLWLWFHLISIWKLLNSEDENAVASMQVNAQG